MNMNTDCIHNELNANPIFTYDTTIPYSVYNYTYTYTYILKTAFGHYGSRNRLFTTKPFHWWAICVYKDFPCILLQLPSAGSFHPFKWWHVGRWHITSSVCVQWMDVCVRVWHCNWLNAWIPRYILVFTLDRDYHRIEKGTIRFPNICQFHKVNLNEYKSMVCDYLLWHSKETITKNHKQNGILSF